MGSTPEAFAADMVADSDGTVVAYKTINGMKYTGASQSADFGSAIAPRGKGRGNNTDKPKERLCFDRV